jgi:hypothetical protein
MVFTERKKLPNISIILTMLEIHIIVICSLCDFQLIQRLEGEKIFETR